MSTPEQPPAPKMSDDQFLKTMRDNINDMKDKLRDLKAKQARGESVDTEVIRSYEDSIDEAEAAHDKLDAKLND